MRFAVQLFLRLLGGGLGVSPKSDPLSSVGDVRGIAEEASLYASLSNAGVAGATFILTKLSKEGFVFDIGSGADVCIDTPSPCGGVVLVLKLITGGPSSGTCGIGAGD